MFVLQLLYGVLSGHQSSLQVLPHLLRPVRLLADEAHVGRVGAEIVFSPLHLQGEFTVNTELCRPSPMQDRKDHKLG